MTYPSYDPARFGCTFKGCGSQQTVTISGHAGRRCAEHPDEFSPDRAVEIAAKGWPGIALAYIRAWGGTA